MAVCSVCLESVAEGEGRSTAKLSCGHAFHLDCIGSAFNAKGRMQCPNCRGVEPGRWLHGNACCLKEDLAEDSLFDQGTEVYRTAGALELNYSRWCPHQGLYGQISMSQEEVINREHGYAGPWGASLHRWQICPYLIGMHDMPGPSTHPESSMALRSYSHDGPWRQGANGVNHVRHSRLAASAHNWSWVPYGGSFQPHEWSLQSYNQSAPNSHANQSPLMFGFLLEGSQSAVTRLERLGTISRPSQNGFDEVEQLIPRHSHSVSLDVALNLQPNNTRARHERMIRSIGRNSHEYYPQHSTITEPLFHGHRLMAPYTSQPWTAIADAHGPRWTNVAPNTTYGVPIYFGAWAPFRSNGRNRTTNLNQEGSQFGGQLRVAS